jgi:competence protein ComGC
MAKNKIKIKGFTLIEALTLIFIFSLITVTFYNVLSVGTSYIQNAKNRLGAISLANEKMEIVRNLKYDDIGVIGGDVSGNIPQDENVTENGKQYSVHTDVGYVDDPMDGLFPNDTVWWEDYKKVAIAIFWNKGGINQGEIKSVSRFVPPGLEVEHPGDGILTIHVFSHLNGDENVSGATVHIANTETGLSKSVQTDGFGNATFMGDTVTNSTEKYQITVTKSGYETVSTLPPYPGTSYDPVDIHASVTTGFPNGAYISQNELAGLKVITADYLDNPIANIDFHIAGGRKMGTDHADPTKIIYNLDTDGKTGANGEKDFGEVSPCEGNSYTFSLSPLVTNYELIGTNPISPFGLAPGQSLNLKVKLADKSATSLLVKVAETVEGKLNPVSDANVKLSNNTGYDVTQTTAADGTVFFPKTSDVFQNGTYDLKITADGFQENNSQVTINNGVLKVETIELTSL